jgi:ADP-ribose pyrophosphatase
MKSKISEKSGEVLSAEKIMKNMNKLKTVFKGKLFTVKRGYIKAKTGHLLFSEVALCPSSVIVFAINDKKQIILTREYRHHLKHTIWRLPGGRIDKGFSPKRAAQRELREEVGYRAKNWQLFFRTHKPVSYIYYVYFYLAKGLTYVGPQREVDEIIKIKPVSLRKAYLIAIKNGFNSEYISYAIIKLWHERKRWLKNIL